MAMELPPEQSQPHRVSALDGYRGLACILVLTQHTWKDGRSILPSAIIAMDIFFALSGFLITGLLLAEMKSTNRISLLNFWKRRAIRLLPPFYIFYSIGAAVYLISGFGPIVGTDPVVTLLSAGLYSTNWALANGYEMGLFAFTWSLSVEEQFYFICPVFFFFAFKYLDKRAIMGILVLLIAAVNIHRYQLFHELLSSVGMIKAWRETYVRFDTRIDSVMIGCLVALFFNVFGRVVRISIHWALAALAIMAFTISLRDIPFARHEPVNSIHTDFMMSGGFTFFAILSMVIAIHLIQFPHSFLTRIFSTRWLVKLGLISYSVYLWHTTAFGGLEILLKSMNSSDFLWTIKALIRGGAAIFLGYIAHRYVELPLIRYLSSRRKYVPIPPPGAELQVEAKP